MQHVPHLDALPQPIYQVIQKGTSFEWDLEQEKALQQATLLLGPYEPTDQIVLKVAVVDKDTIGSLWKAPICKSQCEPLEF